MPVGRPASVSTKIGRLETRHNKHWPGRNLMELRHVFSEGRDANGEVQMCQVWRGALCGPKLFFGLPQKKKNNLYTFSSILHGNSWSLDHKVSKRT
jgi:hypothetical protein